MSAQFDAAEALLKEIQAETAAVRTAVEEQNERVTRVTQDVEAAVKDMRDSETRTRDEMREIREEVNGLGELQIRIRRHFDKRAVSQLEHAARPAWPSARLDVLRDWQR